MRHMQLAGQGGQSCLVVREANYEALQRGPPPPPPTPSFHRPPFPYPLPGCHPHRLSWTVGQSTVEQQQQQQQQRPQKQPSARTTLRNAFRALLWPIRAHPPDRDNGIPEEGEDEVMSQFVPSDTSELSTYSYDGGPSEHDTSPGPYSPSSGPLKMPYYHVDSAENSILPPMGQPIRSEHGRGVGACEPGGPRPITPRAGAGCPGAL